MNKRIYISLPIAIAEKTVAERYKSATEYVKNNYPDYEITGPVNISEFDENGLTTPRDHDYAWYMGQDIENLLRCDAIFMSTGWLDSKGCNAEFNVAKVYNLEIMYQK